MVIVSNCKMTSLVTFSYVEQRLGNNSIVCPAFLVRRGNVTRAPSQPPLQHHHHHPVASINTKKINKYCAINTGGTPRTPLPLKETVLFITSLLFSLRGELVIHHGNQHEKDEKTRLFLSSFLGALRSSNPRPRIHVEHGDSRRWRRLTGSTGGVSLMQNI